MPSSFRFKYKKTKRTRFRKQPLAVKAYKLAKKAYKMPELKYHADGLSTTVTDTGNLIAVDDLQQGTSNNQRIGDTISPTSFKMRMKLEKNAAATSTQVRVIIFRWISEAPAAATDILQTATIQSFKAEDTRFQSEILYDKVFTVNTERPELFRTAKVRLSKHISYPGGSTASNRNSLWLLLLSDEAVNRPTLDWQSRLFYRDS